MKAPQRWIDDPTASAQLKRELLELEATRVPYDMNAGWNSLQSAIDAGASSLTGASAAVTTVKLAPVVLKLVLLAAIGGGVIGGMRWLSADSEATSGASATPQPMASAEPAQLAPPVVTPAPEAVEPKSASERRVKPKSDPEPRAKSKHATDPGREVAQLMRIRALLKRDPSAAHRAILAAQREFPDGLLAEEREGLDAIALARSGELERARAQAERFIERYPTSPLRPQLERLLAGKSL